MDKKKGSILIGVVLIISAMFLMVYSVIISSKIFNNKVTNACINAFDSRYSRENAANIYYGFFQDDVNRTTLLANGLFRYRTVYYDVNSKSLVEKEDYRYLQFYENNNLDIYQFREVENDE